MGFRPEAALRDPRRKRGRPALTLLDAAPGANTRLPNLTRQGTPEASARLPSVPRCAYYLPQFAPAVVPNISRRSDLLTRMGHSTTSGAPAGHD